MDFYVILGVDRAAAPGEIKRAYKRLARKYHPDINPGDRTAAAHFRQISEAYETLSDPDRRRQYDTAAVIPQMVEQFELARARYRPPHGRRPCPRRARCW